MASIIKARMTSSGGIATGGCRSPANDSAGESALVAARAAAAMPLFFRNSRLVFIEWDVEGWWKPAGHWTRNLLGGLAPNTSTACSDPKIDTEHARRNQVGYQK